MLSSLLTKEFWFLKMSRRCSIDAAKGPVSGNKISHSNRKTKRRFLPNLQMFTFLSEVLGKVSLKLSPSTARTIEHNNGIDNFLVTTSNSKLTTLAQKLKKKIIRSKDTKASA